MRTLPVKNPQELAVIRPTVGRRSGEVLGRYSYMTNALWQQVKARQQGFSGVFAWGTHQFDLSSGGQVHYAEGLFVSGEFFDVLEVQPLLGRVFHAGDDHPGCGTPGTVVSYRFWQTELGGDPNVIGRTLHLDGQAFPVIGVTPAGFFGVEIGRSYDVAILTCSEPVIRGARSVYNMGRGWWLAVMGRLKPGWTLTRASAQLEAISPAIFKDTLPTEYQGEEIKWYFGKKLNAYPGGTGLSSLRNAYETPLWLMLAIAGIVLLIACANLANLMLARASARERDIAVRMALGANRGRILRQFLTESVLLAIGGAVAGALLARVLSRVLISYLPTGVSLPLGIDWRIFGFTCGLAVLAAVFFGLAPALRATDASPARAMNSAGRGNTATRGRFTMRRALVVCQVSLSFVLVAAALLFSGSLRNILSIDPGFQRDGIVIMDMDYSSLKLPDAQQLPFRQQLLERLRALPGVDGAAEALIAPISGGGWNDQMIVNGKKNEADVDENAVSAGFFKTFGTPLLAGRDFDDRDTHDAPPVAIVNQQFARKLLGTENPLGRTFKVDVYKGQKQPEYQIVGLVKNTKYQDLRENDFPIAYYPETQQAPTAQIEVIVRSNLSPDTLLPSLRHAVAEVNPAIEIDFHVFRGQIEDGLLRERLMAMLSGSFGVLAMILAMVGLYGVIAYMVVRRTNEIGIRMALGAVPGRILTMVVGEALRLLLIGLAIGIVVAIAAGRAASALLFGITPRDPLTLSAAALGLAFVAVAASLLPAARAARLDPIVALHEE